MKSYKKIRRNQELLNLGKVRLVLNQDGKEEINEIVDVNKALEIAKEYRLDLIEVSTNSNPPVCKLMDYSKFIFENSKKNVITKKKQSNTQVKEMKFRPLTDHADQLIKLRKIKSFIAEGNKCKITIKYRGREMAHQELGIKLGNELKAELEDCAQIEQELKTEGRQVTMVLAPISKKKAPKTKKIVDDNTENS